MMLSPQSNDGAVTLIQMIGTTFGIVSGVVACGVAYLRLFVKNATNESRDMIVQAIDENYARKSELDDVRRRIDRLEEA